MSIYVSDFATWTIIHDDFDHTSVINPDDIVHPTNIDGTENYNYLTLTCPECGSSSTHPVGGGAQPIPVQSMFTMIAYQKSCPCGQLTVTKDTPVQDVASHIRQHCIDMDGIGRWQLDNVVIAKLGELLAASSS